MTKLLLKSYMVHGKIKFSGNMQKIGFALYGVGEIKYLLKDI